MILPTKRINAERSLLSVGAGILDLLDEPKTVSRLWHEFKHPRSRMVDKSPVTYDWFILALDFLYALNGVQMNEGRVWRVEP